MNTTDDLVARARAVRERGQIRASDFARLAGLPERTIRRWCASGHLPARRRGPRLWWISLHEWEGPEDVRALLATVEANREREEREGRDAAVGALVLALGECSSAAVSDGSGRCGR